MVSREEVTLHGCDRCGGVVVGTLRDYIAHRYVLCPRLNLPDPQEEP